MMWSFRKKTKPVFDTTINPSQIRDSWVSKFQWSFNNYLPLNPEVMIYEMLREAIPLADAIVKKRTRLIGDFRVDTLGNKPAQEYIDAVLRNIPVGSFGRGWRTYQNQIIDSVFSTGFGVGEIVPNAMLNGIDRLKVGRARDFRFYDLDRSGNLELCQIVQDEFKPLRLPNQDFIQYAAFDLRNGHPQGRSIFSSVPTIAQIIDKVFTSMDNMIWRFGDPTLVMIYSAGEGEDAAEVRGAVGGMIAAVTRAMKTRKKGGVEDIALSTGKGGSVSLKILGSDAKPIDFNVPLRSLLEQLLSVSGLPAFMFSIQWSTTERMAKEQLEMLIAEINDERSLFDATVEKFVDLSFILGGYAGVKWKHEWDEIGFTDEQAVAQVELLNAQALSAEVQTKLLLRDAGFLQNDDIIDYLIEVGQIKEQTVKQVGREKMIRDIEEKYRINAITKMINA